MEPIQTTPSFLEEPAFAPSYLNVEYFFDKIYIVVHSVVDFLINSKLWIIIGIISGIASLICIVVIIISLVRMREIQIHDKREIKKGIAQALLRDKDREREANPRWHYILTLVENSNESDWRVAIIEADTMMEEILKERGLSGESTSGLLESAKASGYPSIQSAWDAHLVRNQIAHQGSEFPLSQVEARRVIKMYQNFFEDLGVVK